MKWIDGQRAVFKTKWMVTVVIVVGLAGLGYYGAKNVNPTRPLIGEPTAENFDFFARRLNNLMVQNGYKIERYSAELKRTNSMTYPIVGEFECVVGESDLRIRFAWKNGRWIDRGGGYQELADLAQQ